MWPSRIALDNYHCNRNLTTGKRTILEKFLPATEKETINQRRKTRGSKHNANLKKSKCIIIVTELHRDFLQQCVRYKEVQRRVFIKSSETKIFHSESVSKKSYQRVGERTEVSETASCYRIICHQARNRHMGSDPRHSVQPHAGQIILNSDRYRRSLQSIHLGNTHEAFLAS